MDVGVDEAGEARSRALLALPEGAASLPALVQALSDAHWRVRRLAVERLARGPLTGTVVHAVVGLLARRDDPGVRAAAASVLARWGSPAVPPLLQALADPRVEQRRQAAEILGEARQPQAAPQLVQALADPDPTVRVAVAEALGKVGGATAREALQRLVSSADPLLRVCALEGLVALRAPPALPRLVPLLDDAQAHRSAWRLLGWVRHPAALARVARGLGAVGSRDAALAALGQRAELLGPEEGAPVRRALRASAGAAAWLERALAHDELEIARGALLAAQAWGPAELAPAVAASAQNEALAPLVPAVLVHLGLAGARALLAGVPPALASLPRDAALVAGEAIVQLSDPSLVEPLRGLLEAGDPGLAELAVRALGRSRARTAIAPLAALFSDEALATHAARALVSLSAAWPAEVEAALAPLAAGRLAPHLVRAWAQVAPLEQARALLRRAGREGEARVRAAAVELSALLGDAAALSALEAAQVDEAPAVRRAAADALASLASPGAVALRPLLEAALADADPSVVAAGTRAARDLGAAWAAPALSRLVGEASTPVVIGALGALVATGQLAAPELERALAHPDPEVLSQALTLAADRPQAVARAPALLEHPHWDVRVAAARVLAISGELDRVPELRRAVDREEDAIARALLAAAADALACR